MSLLLPGRKWNSHVNFSSNHEIKSLMGNYIIFTLQSQHQWPLESFNFNSLMISLPEDGKKSFPWQGNEKWMKKASTINCTLEQAKWLLVIFSTTCVRFPGFVIQATGCSEGTQIMARQSHGAGGQCGDSPAPSLPWPMARTALTSGAECAHLSSWAGLLSCEARFLCRSTGISCFSSCLLCLQAQAVALLPSWQHTGGTSCAGHVKAILWFFLCSHWEIKARTSGTAKREPNYIYNIKVSAFVVLPFSRVFHK